MPDNICKFIFQKTTKTTCIRYSSFLKLMRKNLKNGEFSRITEYITFYRELPSFIPQTTAFFLKREISFFALRHPLTA